MAVIIGHAGGHDFRALQRAGTERRRKAEQGAGIGKALTRWSGILVVIVLSSSPLGEQLCISIYDETEIALHAADGIDAGGDPVDPVDAPEQSGRESDAGAKPSSGRDSSFCATARTT
jgi:hypothetical protein